MSFNFFSRLPYKKVLAKLEIAKRELVAELNQKDIKFLVEKLSSDALYSPLILEKREIDGTYESGDGVSWYAYQHSNTLCDPGDKKVLLGMLIDPSYIAAKKQIYLCLSSLCANTNDRDLFNFLIEKMEEENNDSISIVIMARMEKIKKDSTFNLAPIKTALAEGTYHVVAAAIKALANTNDTEVESLLLSEFQIVDKHLKAMICGSLETRGTSNAIPILKKEYKKTRDVLLKSSIDQTIHAIEKRGNAKNT
jgi:hypothetical protein